MAVQRERKYGSKPVEGGSQHSGAEAFSFPDGRGGDIEGRQVPRTSSPACVSKPRVQGRPLFPEDCLMPLYDYECENDRCPKSKMVMEFIVPLSVHDAQIKCPKCGKPLKKMLSAPYFKIK
jgi:putative FmdB family regulatory protein